MRHYCKLLVDPITGTPMHMSVSSEPLNDGVGIIAENTELHILVIGDPGDGLLLLRAFDIFPKLQGNAAKVFSYKPSVPQNQRPTIIVGQEALDIIEAREIVIGRRPPP